MINDVMLAMKEKILVVLLCFGLFAFAQQKKYNIEWSGFQPLSTGSYTFNVPSFNKENFSYHGDQGLLFVAQWAINSDIDESSVELSNIKFETISSNDLGDLKPEDIVSELSYSLKNAKARNKRYAYFQLSPILKEANGTFKRVISFQINYSNRSISNKTGLTSKNFNLGKTISNSVLSSGEWYRFYVDTTGVFRLSKSFLQRLGVNVNGVDPRNIKLYGNGGRMIPYSNAIPYPFDVVENAIKFVGEEDGVFNNEDYILFYAKGPKEFNADSNTNINCYTDKTYYYINVSSGPGKRIQPFSQPVGTPNLIIDTFQEYQFHEIDEYNIATIGRRWFGNRFDILPSGCFNSAQCSFGSCSNAQINGCTCTRSIAYKVFHNAWRIRTVLTG